MIVLGLHKDPWHNSGAAMIRADEDGVRFANLAEERLDRVKDSRDFPERSTRACMEALGVRSFSEIDLVVLDYIFDRDWRNDPPRLSRVSRESTFLDQIDPARIHIVNHHLAHAHNVFYSSPFDSAAILIVDGRGSERETQSLYAASADGIELMDSTTTFGIGLLYASVTQAVGFALMQEGKTMGLAPYGASVERKMFDFPRRFRGIETDYDSVCANGNYQITIPHAPIVTFEDRARASFEVQQECEAALLHLAEVAAKRTGARHLCISGGVALNSVANYAVLRSGWFDDIFINPAASDTGIPLGAALYGYHTILKQPKTYRGISPYLGPDYSDEELSRAIADVRCERLTNGNALGAAADLLAANRIVACHHGRSEMGPRALGNRSILMNPGLAENKDVLNDRVKHREAFRPFAPVTLESHAGEYFEIDRPSPYMLLVPPVREEKRAVIPAVTHVDGTARLQTVTEAFNPHLHALLTKFHEKTGVPVLLNTSFNDNNQPIVETPADAVAGFLSMDIDALLIGETLLVKE
jgi:carbamoyltransferase